MNFSDGLAAVRKLLIAGHRSEARTILEALRLGAGPDERWLEFVNLDALTADEVSYLEQFVLQSQGIEQRTLPSIVPQAKPITAEEMADGIMQVRTLLAAKENDSAQALLKQLYASATATQAPSIARAVMSVVAT